MNSEEFYYSIKPIMKKVNKTEFQKYIQNYPRRLIADAFGACMPPYVTYNDPELADRWPYSVVASTYLYDDKPDGYFYKPEEKRDYEIMENYEEVFNSRTGNKTED